jgi:hypothetical protein
MLIKFSTHAEIKQIKNQRLRTIAPDIQALSKDEARTAFLAYILLNKEVRDRTVIFTTKKGGAIMENAKEVKVEDYTELYGHTPARPLKYVKDKDGYGWLCDKDIDPDRDLRKQGCWRRDEMAFLAGN